MGSTCTIQPLRVDYAYNVYKIIYKPPPNNNKPSPLFVLNLHNLSCLFSKPYKVMI